MTHDAPRTADPQALADEQQAAVDAVEAQAEHRISDGCDGDAPAHWLAIQNAAVKQLTAENDTLRAELTKAQGGAVALRGERDEARRERDRAIRNEARAALGEAAK